MIGRPVRLYVTKYDGSFHWEQNVWFVMQRGSLIVTQAFTGEEALTSRGPWTLPTDMRTFFWEDRWYSVIRNTQPIGRSNTLWYCNIATPALFDGANLHYVDLDLDVAITADGAVQVRDEDDFERNAALYKYPENVKRAARRAVDELLGIIERREFPFQSEDRPLL